MTQLEQPKRTSVVWWPFIMLLLVVAGLWGGAWFAIVTNTRLSSWTERGTFGDMFGAVNALFSGLAFAGVIYAILLQRNELELQRDELTLTRKELHDSSVAQQASADALTRQIDLLLLSARLNAYSSLIQSCNAKIQADTLEWNGLSQTEKQFYPRDSTRIPEIRAAHEEKLTAILAEIESTTTTQTGRSSG